MYPSVGIDCSGDVIFGKCPGRARSPNGHFETIFPSPDPMLFVEHRNPPGADGPAPDGVDFQIWGNNANSGYGEATAPLQYVPGGTVGPADFSNFVAGNIAVVDRGAINFSLKTVNAEAAGASGVIIANSANWISFDAAARVTTIPTAIVVQDLGQSLIADLNAGVDLHAHLIVVPDNEPIPDHEHDAIPEPSTFLLAALGLLALLGFARRRRK